MVVILVFYIKFKDIWFDYLFLKTIRSDFDKMIFSEESHDWSLEGLTNGNNNQNLYETVGSTFMQTGVWTRTRETNQELNQSESTDYTPCRVDEDWVEGYIFCL